MSAGGTDFSAGAFYVSAGSGTSDRVAELARETGGVECALAASQRAGLSCGFTGLRGQDGLLADLLGVGGVLFLGVT